MSELSPDDSELLCKLTRLQRQLDYTIGLLKGGLLIKDERNEFRLLHGEMIVGDYRITPLSRNPAPNTECLPF